MFRFCLLFPVFFTVSIKLFSQNIITEAEAVNNALKNSPNLSAATFSVLQQKQLLKSSFNLPNPEIFIESPTGNFYTPSITQSVEFPSVYGKQKQLQKQQVQLAEKEKQLTENEVKYQVKQLYLDLQYQAALNGQLYIKDTVYEKIALSASRQFEAGQIDYLQKLFAETEYAEIHNQYLQQQLIIGNLQQQLQYLTATTETFITEPLNTNPVNNYFVLTDSLSFALNPSVQILQQQNNIAKKNVELQKAKSLPGLAFGYFNQGEKSTPVYNRFRFGFTLPLWYGQYKSIISGAKTAVQINNLKTAALQQQFYLQLKQAENEAAMFARTYQYYQSTGIKKADEIIAVSNRFFQSGAYDYITYLRNINTAYIIQQKYLEANKNYQQALLTIKFLTATL